MNLKPSVSSPLKPLLLVLVVTALTAFFLYSQIMGPSFLVRLWFLTLIALMLLSKLYPAINSPVIRMMLISMLIYLSLKYGIFFLQAQASNLIALYAAILFPVIFISPRLMTYINLTLVLFFSSSSYGIKGRDALVEFLGGIFGRGSQHGISYVNMFLIATMMSVIYQTIINKKDDSYNRSCNLYKYFLIFNALFFIYMLNGITLGIDINDILSAGGVIHVINMGILVFIMLRIFSTKEEYEQLKMYFLWSIMLRGVWAIVRFIFFNGDGRNPYIDFSNKVFVKITLFDIGDGIIQCIALFYALFMLLNKGDRILPKKEVLFYWLIAFVGLFNIVFSYRRTGWFGLLLAFGWLILNLKAEKRIAVVFMALIIGVSIFTGVAANRFESSMKKDTHGIFSDISTEGEGISFEKGRFVELNRAWQTIKYNLVFGLGPWGDYKIIINHVEHASKFTHSSVFHMLLKMGIIGLFVFTLICYGYVHFWLTKRKEIPLHVRGFAEASFAGFIFFIPGILFGTPIIEYRHMMLLGFVMSIPYISYHIYKAESSRLNLPEHLNNANQFLKHL